MADYDFNRIFDRYILLQKRCRSAAAQKGLGFLCFQEISGPCNRLKRFAARYLELCQLKDENKGLGYVSYTVQKSRVSIPQSHTILLFPLIDCIEDAVNIIGFQNIRIRYISRFSFFIG